MKHASVPSVSVVVPTYNRRGRLHRVLQSLADQVINEPFEVVVVSDGSTDGTHEYLLGGDLPLSVVPVLQPNRGPAAARNAGLERARGELVVFVDDDVVADSHLLRAHLEAHRRHGPYAVVIGPMLDPEDHAMSPWIAWEQAMLAKQYRDLTAGVYEATPRQFYTGNASVRREHLVEIGGFDTSFRRAEDIELAFRLDDHGLTFHFAPEARGYHYADRTYDAWKRAAYVYGRNEVVFARDRGRYWIYEFSSRRFEQHHVAIRRLIAMAVGSPRSRRWTVSAMERIVRARGAGRANRYALSVIYAVEFHCGMADELASEEAFRAMVEHGVAPTAMSGD